MDNQEINQENINTKVPDSLTFGQAIQMLKQGRAVARTNWNGKGMFIYYVPGGEYQTQTNIAERAFGVSVKYNPYLAIKNVNDTVSTWVPSINDVLAEDWVLVDIK